MYDSTSIIPKALKCQAEEATHVAVWWKYNLLEDEYNKHYLYKRQHC